MDYRRRVHVAFLLLAIVAVCKTYAAQSLAPAAIEGRIVDARTGAGLAKVAVSVASGGPSTLTDGDGRFRLASVAAGRVRLSVSVVGYIHVQREITLTPGETLAVVVPLTEGTGTYTETVNVAADVFRTVQAGVPSQQVLGSADLQNLRGVLADDPLRAVQVLPGVATGDDLRSEFSVRGSGFDRMNFTVEGFATPFLLHTVRAIEDVANSGSIAMINSDILEDVTVLNGGYAQRHGNRTGAEIEFRLREGSRDRRQLRGAISGTSGSVVLEGPLGRKGRGSWLLSGRKSYLDLLLRRLREDGMTFAFSDVQSKTVYDLSPRQRVELTIVAGASRAREENPDDPSLAFVGRNRAIVSVAGWRITGRRGLLTVRALGAFNSFRNEWEGEPDRDLGRTRQIAARVEGTLPLRRGLELEGGGQIERTRESRERWRSFYGEPYQIMNDYSGSAVRSGAFARLHWTPAPTVAVSPGLRVDRSGLTDEATASPWINGEWHLPARLTVRAGAGIYRQFAEFEQAIGSLGSSSNVHERAVHADLGVEGRIGDTARWQIAVYDRREHDFMRRVGAEPRVVGNGWTIPGFSGASYRNRLDGRARGVELLVQRRTPNGLSGWISYSYGHSRYDDRVSREAFWGDLDQRHTLNVYAFYRASDRTSFTSKLRFGTNFPVPGYYDGTAGHYVLVERRNELRLPIYSRIDLRANRTFTWSQRRVTLFAEVMNVLNRDNVRVATPRVDFETRRVRRLFEPVLPIVPSVGLLIEF